MFKSLKISFKKTPIKYTNDNNKINFTDSSLSQLHHPHSTTSPKGSPNNNNTDERSAQSNSSSQNNDENENNNNLNENYDENDDDISVTGSTKSDTDDGGKKSPATNLGGGAFTSLIQRNHQNSLIKPGLPGHPTSFNQHLAAQLFLQTPLIPPPSQWLYTQLYGSYQDLPWFRNSFPANSSFRGLSNPDNNITDLSKRTVTLISHQDDEKDLEEEQRSSPPISSSTKRSPSPSAVDRETDEKNVDGKIRKIEGKEKATIRSRTPKQTTDVWRPY